MKQRIRHMERQFHKWWPYLLVWITIPTSLYIAYAPPLSELWPRTDNNKISQGKSERISPYDEIIHRNASNHQIDWRLIASMIHTESSFRKDAVSPAGAQGLMQIMPAVAREQGVASARHPEENIRAGIVHYKRFAQLIRGKSPEDTLALSLAAYNAGLGHVRDAQRLAKRMKINHRSWKNVHRMLLLLEEPFYYKEATYGFCKGTETVEYVSRVLKKYATYRAKFPTPPVHAKIATSAPDFDA